MTVKELSQLYYLNREIEREQLRIRELKDAATNTAAKPITTSPGAGGISDNTAIIAQVVDCEVIIKAKQQVAAVEYKRLIEYINGIDDSLIRQIIALRFVNGLKWRQVAEHIGGNNTEDSVKKACYRYIKKSCPECPEDM